MNKMMDIFKPYVDNNNGIFSIINGNSEDLSYKLINKLDWNDLPDNSTIYLPIDKISGMLFSNQGMNDYVFCRWKDTRNDNNFFSLCVTSTGTRYTVDNFTSNLLTIKNGGATYTSFIRISASQSHGTLVTIDDKEYLQFIIDWEYVISNFSLYQYMGDIVSNIGYYQYGYEPNDYKWYTPTLDFDYLYEHSGDKYISRLVERLLDENEELPETSINKLASIIKDKYVEKWNREYDVLIESVYNPIHNYEMNEETRRNSKIVSSGYSNTYGFNTVSEDGVPSEKSGATTEGNIDDNYEVHSRGGNIGVTTTQKLVEEELELRKHNIYEMIMNDVDVVLCNAIYDIER